MKRFVASYVVVGARHTRGFSVTSRPGSSFVHAQHDAARNRRYTAVFDDVVTGEAGKRVLLDHVLVSPGLVRETGLRKVYDSGRARRHEYREAVAGDGSRRQDRPSDHRPVSVELRF
jgi:hypothetical protein